MKLLLVEDEEHFFDSFQRNVKNLYDDVDILWASRCEDAVKLANENPDVHTVFLDLGLPGYRQNPIEALKAFRKACESMRVVVMSGRDDPDLVAEALGRECGATSYILKGLPMKQLLLVIQLVLAGGVWIPPEALACLSTNGEKEDQQKDVADVYNIAPRVYRAGKLMVDGLPNKTIANEMGISEQQVKQYIGVLLRELGVAKRTYAMAEIARRKLVFSKDFGADKTSRARS